MNFLHVVAGTSLMYKLKRVGASTDPCGRPFFCTLHELLMSPVWTLTAKHGRTLDSFTNRTLCHTVSSSTERQLLFCGVVDSHHFRRKWIGVDIIHVSFFQAEIQIDRCLAFRLLLSNPVVTDVRFGHLFVVCIKHDAFQEVTCGLFRKRSHCS